MLNLSPFSLAAPWLLGFLAAVPILWWLLRLMPPAPKKIVFPALALLQGLTGREETPSRSPWWLLLLRLLILILLIFALAKPLINPLPISDSKGVLLLVVDNDWAAARDWNVRHDGLHNLLRDATRNHRSVLLLTTTVAASGDALTLNGTMAAESAAAIVDALTPEPWGADWVQSAAALAPAAKENVSEVVWMASGVGNNDAKAFYKALQKIAPVKVIGTTTPIYTLSLPMMDGDALSIKVQRAATEAAAALEILAVAKDGHGLAHWIANFAEGSPQKTASLEMPSEVRNQIARFEIASPHTAASVALLDAAWEHHDVGIVGDAAELDRHSLLSEIYYIARALKPYAELHVDSLEALMKTQVPVIILPDTVVMNNDTVADLATWIEHGGVLLRFAGEGFAAVEDHEKESSILPVPLRAGGRSLGGALTWATPQKLQAFPATSPFHNLMVPDDVTINRQVLAEPSADIGTKTWAALADGTPLVTASKMGQGISILFHVPAKASWSNLPISGLFVEMLQHILQLAQGDHSISKSSSSIMQPLSVLDAYGEQHQPTSTALPFDSDDLHATRISPHHPPGLYGTEANAVALNLGVEIGQPELLRDVPLEEFEKAQGEINLQPYLLVAACLLLLVDFLISLRMRGFLKLVVVMLCICGWVTSAHASEDTGGVELTSKTYLAYVRTGDASVDHTSELGLRGLAALLQNRTSIDHIGVAEVDPNSDDLAFFPLLYWPVVASEHQLSREGAARVSYYLHHGGMILFDAVGGETVAPGFLRHVLAGVDIPPLVRLPDHHVLKRSFYLLDDFPGRFAGHDFWLEPEEVSATDGVASVLYGSNDWAAAWALDETGRPLYPCTPDGEIQRERAFRFGVNLVMYALTGNYKSDQMQTTALLKRMK